MCPNLWLLLSISLRLFILSPTSICFIPNPLMTVFFQSPGDQQIQPHYSHVLPAGREDPEGEAGEGGPDPLLQSQQHQGTVQVKTQWHSKYSAHSSYLNFKDVLCCEESKKYLRSSSYLSHGLSREEGNWPISLHRFTLQPVWLQRAERRHTYLRLGYISKGFISISGFTGPPPAGLRGDTAEEIVWTINTFFTVFSIRTLVSSMFHHHSKSILPVYWWAKWWHFHSSPPSWWSFIPFSCQCISSLLSCQHCSSLRGRAELDASTRRGTNKEERSEEDSAGTAVVVKHWHESLHRAHKSKKSFNQPI